MAPRLAYTKPSITELEVTYATARCMLIPVSNTPFSGIGLVRSIWRSLVLLLPDFDIDLVA